MKKYSKIPFPAEHKKYGYPLKKRAGCYGRTASTLHNPKKPIENSLFVYLPDGNKLSITTYQDKLLVTNTN